MPYGDGTYGTTKGRPPKKPKNPKGVLIKQGKKKGKKKKPKKK